MVSDSVALLSSRGRERRLKRLDVTLVSECARSFVALLSRCALSQVHLMRVFVYITSMLLKRSIMCGPRSGCCALVVAKPRVEAFASGLRTIVHNYSCISARVGLRLPKPSLVSAMVSSPLWRVFFALQRLLRASAPSLGGSRAAEAIAWPSLGVFAATP